MLGALASVSFPILIGGQDTYSMKYTDNITMHGLAPKFRTDATWDIIFSILIGGQDILIFYETHTQHHNGLVSDMIMQNAMKYTHIACQTYAAWDIRSVSFPILMGGQDT